MKYIFAIAICLTLIVGAFGQEKYSVPDITSEQKHNRTNWQFWVIHAAGINFAKAQDISPYEYGKHLGNLYAPSWNSGEGFEGFVNGMILNWETFKSDEDGSMTIKENSDGSVSVVYPIEAWKKHLPDGNLFASYQESMESLRGILETIANHMGCTIVQEIGQESIYYTINKK